MNIRRLKRHMEDSTPELVNLIIFLLGLLAILAVMLIPAASVEWRSACTGIGTSLISTSIVAYLASLYLRKREATDIMLKTWKVAGVYRTRSEMNDDVNPLLEDTSTLDICAFGLRGFRDSRGSLVQERLKSGLKLRILVPHPDSKHVAERNMDEQHSKGQLKSEILGLIDWCHSLRSLNAKTRNRVQLRLYERSLLDFYFRVDDLLCVGPYLPNMTSQQTISYTFARGGRGYDYWECYFRTLWEDETFCRDGLKKEG